MTSRSSVIRYSILGDARQLLDAFKEAEQKLSFAEKLQGRFQKGMESGLKWLRRGVIGLGAAVVGMAVHGGISRALSIEDAQAKLRGLGFSMRDIKAITESVTDAVTGTRFALNEAFSLAPSLIAAGVKPGEDLTRTLGLIADTAVLTGADLESMGLIFSKVMAGNRVTMREVNQLLAAGVPILQGLADQFGVSVSQIRTMVSQGKVSAEDFLAVMARYEGVAKTAGDTTTGAFANMRTALSRVGAEFATRLMPTAKQFFDNSKKWIDSNMDTVRKWADGTVKWLRGVGTMIGVVGDAWSALPPIVQNSVAVISIALYALMKHPFFAVVGGMAFMVGKVGEAFNALDRIGQGGGFVGFMNKADVAMRTMMGNAFATGLVIEEANRKAADSTAVLSRETGKARDAALHRGRAVKTEVGALGDLDDAQREAAVSARDARNATRNYHDALRALVDPVFAANQAQREYAETVTRVGKDGKVTAEELDELTAAYLRVQATEAALTPANVVQWAQFAQDALHDTRDELGGLVHDFEAMDNLVIKGKLQPHFTIELQQTMTQGEFDKAVMDAIKGMQRRGMLPAQIGPL